MTAIQWTDKTWNPLRGCSRVSEGCRHCYAERVAHRFSGPGQPYEGLTTPAGRWSGVVKMVPEKLREPLGWRKPAMVFVNSMSDLFHEAVTDEYIAAVFGVMAASPRHTFQVLTKRPERARKWFEWYAMRHGTIPGASAAMAEAENYTGRSLGHHHPQWPLPNVWLGVSVEDQKTAAGRIPILLDCPAAVRWVSYEPALGPVDFAQLDVPGLNLPPNYRFNALIGGGRDTATPWRVDWLVIGGESGPGARPCEYGWIRSAVQQCKNAGVAVFVKQVGTHYIDTINGVAGRGARYDAAEVGRPLTMRLRDLKGGDPAEWPECLRVRQWPDGIPKEVIP